MLETAKIAILIAFKDIYFPFKDFVIIKERWPMKEKFAWGERSIARRPTLDLGLDDSTFYFQDSKN